MVVILASGAERSVLVTNPEERRQAGEFLAVLGEQESPVAGADRPDLPDDLATVLKKVLETMARGGTITIGSLPDSLTTTIAAEQLGVSRPTLMKMIAAGEIPAHKVGTHHRLKTSDVLALKRERLESQRRGLDELRELEDALDEFGA